nr:hypothetical protein [Tanacetum cinerariifolium]
MITTLESCHTTLQRYATQMAIDYAAGGRLRKLRVELAWETIKNLAQYKGEGWNEPIFPNKGSPDYIDAKFGT